MEMAPSFLSKSAERLSAALFQRDCAESHGALRSASTLFGISCDGWEGAAARCSTANLLTLQEPVPGCSCK